MLKNNQNKKTSGNPNIEKRKRDEREKSSDILQGKKSKIVGNQADEQNQKDNPSSTEMEDEISVGPTQIITTPLIQEAIQSRNAEAGKPSASSLKLLQVLKDADLLVKDTSSQCVYKAMYTENFPPIEGVDQLSVQSNIYDHNATQLLYSSKSLNTFYKPLLVVDEPPTEYELNIFIGAVVTNDSKDVQSQLERSSEKRKVQLINGEGIYNIQNRNLFKSKRANALEIAAKNGFDDIVRTIFNAVSDPNLKKKILLHQLQMEDTTGSKKARAFDIAEKFKRTEILKILLDEAKKVGINFAEREIGTGASISQVSNFNK